jgi:hypothetical protein
MPDTRPQDDQPEDVRPPSDPGAQETPVEQVVVERRTFEDDEAKPRRDVPVSPAEGRLGPAADPAEGKR